jgi:ABC-2 type transport system permease protein
MIPIYLAYILNVSTSLLFNLSFGLSFLFIPLVPTVIGALIGTLITGISSKFKHKNFFNIIFNIILMILIMYVSYSTNTLNSKALAQISQSILNFFNHVYPLTNIYHKALNGQILYLIIYIIISLGIYELYKYLTVIFFDKINSNLKSITIINKYDNKKNKINVPLISLFKKEFSHYLSSTIYFLNTGVGMILLTIATISLIISGPKNLGSLLNIPNLSNIINKSLPLIIALFSALSCTTYPSISLEGKNFWILKTLPIKTNTILKSKLLLNYIITIPLIIINTSILAIYLHLSLINYLFSLIIPILYALFIAGYGLFINILMPDFEWSNEVKVIKQSTSSLVSIFTGLILVMVPLTINYSISNNKFMILLISIILLLNILIYYLLFTIGKKKYELL